MVGISGSKAWYIGASVEKEQKIGSSRRWRSSSLGSVCLLMPLGLCWNEYLMRPSSFYQPVPTREHGTVKRSGIQSE